MALLMKKWCRKPGDKLGKRHDASKEGSALRKRISIPSRKLEGAAKGPETYSLRERRTPLYHR